MEFSTKSLVNTMYFIMVILLGLLLASPSQAGKMYKWVDAEGHVHFSQTKPKNQDKAPQSTEQVRFAGMADGELAKQIPPEVMAEFCSGLRKAAKNIASKMRAGYSANKALTVAHSDSLGVAVKQLVGFVYGYRPSSMSAYSIAELAHNQCMNGAYAHYLRDKIPAKQAKNDAKAKAGTSFGTAWPVASGQVLTNYHVVSGHNKITLILTSGEKLSAKVTASDQDNDMALLTVENAEKLPLGLPISADNIAIGSPVFTIGYPYLSLMGSEPKLTSGIVNAMSGLRGDKRFMQISVPVQAGNSGGPLLNMQGEVVGMVTAKLNAVAVYEASGDLPQNVNYALKASLFQQFLPSGLEFPDYEAGEEATLAVLAQRIKSSIMIVVAE